MSASRMYELLASAAREQGISPFPFPEAKNIALLHLGTNPAKVILHGRILPSTDLAMATVASLRSVSNILLREAGILVPQSLKLQVWPVEDALLSPDTQSALIDFLTKGGRWALKPGMRGAGSPVNLNVTEFRDITGHLEDHAKAPSEWVLEEFIDGTALAVLVVAGEVVAARQQAAFSLTGDGQKTLEELIDAYNAEADANAQFMMNAEARQLLRDQNAYLGEVVQAGQIIRLSNTPLDFQQTASVSSDHLNEILDLVGRVQKIFAGPVMGLDLIMAPEGIHVIGLDLAPEWIEFVEEQEAADVAARLLHAALK